MKRFLALLITLILFVFSVSYAESSFFIGEELPEHSIYATAVVGDQYVLYDTMGPHYCLYRGETFLSDLPSLTNFDTNDDMLLIDVYKRQGEYLVAAVAQLRFHGAAV